MRAPGCTSPAPAQVDTPSLKELCPGYFTIIAGLLSNLRVLLYNPGMPRNRSRSAAIDAALLAAVAAHPRDLTRTVASQLGISRQAVAARARVLVESGSLASSGTTR